MEISGKVLLVMLVVAFNLATAKSRPFIVNPVLDFTGSHESPSEGAAVSGINVIRGWACDAESMNYQIDDGAVQPLLYGQFRADTQATCGDTDNGYAQIINWNKLGDGLHTLRIFIDGAVFATRSFTVTTLGELFLRDAAAVRIVDNFPNEGDVTTLTWSEKNQNFIVSAFVPASNDPCGTVQCKPLPAGIYESAGPTNAVANAVDSAALNGLLVRISWKVCGDDMDCLYDMVQSQLDQALIKGLKVALMIMDADQAPDSVKARCQTFDFTFRNNPASMCLAWDENYLQDKQQLITELGARFDSHPALAYVYFTGACSTNGAEGHCRIDEAAYTAIGYTPTVLSDAYIKVMDMYREAFVSTPIAFEVHAIFNSATVWRRLWDDVAPEGRVGVAAWWCAERLSLNGNETVPVWSIVQEAAARSFSVCQTVGNFTDTPYRFSDSTLALDYGLEENWNSTDSSNAFNETLDWAQGDAVHALQPATIDRFSVMEAWSIDLKDTASEPRWLLF